MIPSFLFLRECFAKFEDLFVVDLCLGASILKFLNRKGNHWFETLHSLLGGTNHLKMCKLQWEEILNFLCV